MESRVDKISQAVCNNLQAQWKGNDHHEKRDSY